LSLFTLNIAAFDGQSIPIIPTDVVIWPDNHIVHSMKCEDSRMSLFFVFQWKKLWDLGNYWKEHVNIVQRRFEIVCAQMNGTIQTFDQNAEVNIWHMKHKA
jgi:hypothetical protein